MRQDSRLSGVLHLLLHMAEQDSPLTSEALAKAMETNPVVIRRILAGLREAGHVRSEKGHGGGWMLARPLRQVSLRDIYAALGTPPVLAIANRSDNPKCLVEQAVNAALDRAFHEAQAALLARLRDVTLADLQADFRKRLARQKPRRKAHQDHG